MSRNFFLTAYPESASPATNLVNRDISSDYRGRCGGSHGQEKPMNRTGNAVRKWSHRCELRYLLIAGWLALVSLSAGAQPTMTRVSLNHDGFEADQPSHSSSISANGRYVAFQSRAFNLFSGTPEGYRDIFVKDRITGAVDCASIDNSGFLGNNHSDYPSLSEDGRYVAFESLAGTFAVGDPLRSPAADNVDVFVKDRMGSLACVSLNLDGVPGDGPSRNACISADGRYVAFESGASDLVSGDTGGYWDIFVRDRVTGTTERVSVSATGVPGNRNSFNPRISANGRYVAFESLAFNLVPNDLGNRSDIFVKDRWTGAIERVSVNAAGEEANNHSNWPALSADGRYVAFRCGSANLIPDDPDNFMDIFIKDRETGAVERVSIAGEIGIPLGSAPRHYPTLSADGRYIAFDSSASNLVTGDTNSQTDVFMKDRATGTIERLSVSTAGGQGSHHSEAPSLSADGRYVSFHSGSKFTANDFNSTDVFVRGPLSSALTVSGIVTLEDLVETAKPQTVTFTFRATGFPDIVLTAEVGPTGFFWVTGLEPRSYTLHVKAGKWLGASVAVDTSAGDVSNVEVTLKGGDANGDNSIDVLDLDRLIQAFDSSPDAPNWNAEADFNGDDSVDVLDLDVLIRNFDTTGAE
jgi:Tol biopolymer transport system component